MMYQSSIPSIAMLYLQNLLSAKRIALTSQLDQPHLQQQNKKQPIFIQQRKQNDDLLLGAAIWQGYGLMSALTDHDPNHCHGIDGLYTHNKHSIHLKLEYLF